MLDSSGGCVQAFTPTWRTSADEHVHRMYNADLRLVECTCFTWAFAWHQRPCTLLDGFYTSRVLAAFEIAKGDQPGH